MGNKIFISYKYKDADVYPLKLSFWESLGPTIVRDYVDVDYIKEKESSPKTYEIPVRDYEKGIKGFFKAFRSWSILLIYSVLLCMLFLIYFFN